ncbi:hypothetical protein H5410_025661 [Solanum commersonii]|uniref:Retrotransposon Copia-like N-terminal domain-containing protein n=1 Tax=Solanum commersonii TaxID=4109 RepID=A0A9J5YUE4_SOLCO|nr:hypothetical protein H5410_025661 [Solanum commersonii]
MGETSSSSMMPSSSPNLAHQLPVKLTSSNYLLWKTQFMPMIFACGLNHHIDESILPQLVGATTAANFGTNFVLRYASDQGHTFVNSNRSLHTFQGRDNIGIESYVQRQRE